MKRDKISREKMMKRIDNQWDDKLKVPLADFVINNVNWENTLMQIEAIHKKIYRNLSLLIFFCK
jgi:dephospho-CoA kinase